MKRIVFLLIISLIIVALIVIGIFKLTSKQNLTLNFINDTSDFVVDIYKNTPGESDNKPRDSDIVVRNISTTQTVKLSSGSYKVISQSNNKYKPVVLKFYIDDKPYSLDIKNTYSDSELSKLLAIEQPGILSVIRAKYPNIDDLFIINKGSLYNRGNWFGTTLVSKNPHPNKNDTLRIITEKQGNQWVVITAPPQIVISKQEYPSIPGNIIDSVNNL